MRLSIFRVLAGRFRRAGLALLAPALLLAACDSDAELACKEAIAADWPTGLYDADPVYVGGLDDDELVALSAGLSVPYDMAFVVRGVTLNDEVWVRVAACSFVTTPDNLHSAVIVTFLPREILGD